MATKTLAELRRAAGLRPETYAVCVLNRKCLGNTRETQVPLMALQMELKNYLAHGRAQHAGDWFHEWSRTSQGTLSWDCVK